MNTRLLTIAIFASAAATAQTPEGLPCWRDLNLFTQGGQTARTELVFHPTRQEALNGSVRSSSYYLDLCGRWDFRYYDDSRDCPEGIFAEPDGWSSIRVPGNWEVQGFGTPIYVNTVYEFKRRDVTPPELPDPNPLGVYRHRFEVPASWQGRQIYLNFDGVKGGAQYYVNGTLVGYNNDSKDPIRFNVTKLLHAGTNEIGLKVYRWSTGSYLECMDFWRISGIEREVYLSTESTDSGFDFEVVSTFAEDLHTGDFRLRLRSREPVSFSAELLDPEGRTVAAFEPQRLDDSLELSATLERVLPWSAETPNLYTLLMKVGEEWTRFRVGFRRFEITTIEQQGRTFPVFLVNGQPVKFKGVNLHEHDPWTGHYVTRELLLKDMKLMKMLNINAIRTAHYPQQREFYELCDSLGFYVYSEANIESHGMGYELTRTLGNAPEWYGNHLYRELNMYERVRNYPCVTILSLGNEGGNGYNFYRLYEVIKAREKQGMNRPVCYERAEFEWNTDMLVPQYPGAEWFRRMGEEGSDRPVVPSEYAHAMGNSTGSLDLQWESIYRYPNLQGGFIWDWVDQALAARRADGRFFWAYGGDYGKNTPSDNNFLCNGLVLPDRRFHPGAFEVRHVYQNVEMALAEENAREWVLDIRNRFYFRTLDGLELEARVVCSSPREGVSRELLVRTFPLSAAAQQSQTIRIPKPDGLPQEGLLCLNLDVRTSRREPLLDCGTLLATEQLVLREDNTPAKTPAAPVKERLQVKKSDGGVRIHGDRVDFRFEKGVVTSLVFDGEEKLAPDFGIRPNFWRGPTDNDYGNGQPARSQLWKEAGQHPERCTWHVKRNGDRVELTAVYPVGAHRYTVVYTVRPDAAVEVSATLACTPSESRMDIPRVGLRLRVPLLDGEPVPDPIRYFARGPHENYRDRFSSARLGLYESTASAEYFPYVRPQENGHHIDCSFLEAGGLRFTAVGAPFEFNALRNSVEDFDAEDAVQCDYQWPNYTSDEPHDPAQAANRLRRQTHISDITPRNYVEVCLDAAHNAVGGYDSWGARPEESRTVWDDRDWSFTFIISSK